jgi:predicted DCC family thiol-disulfide oxidoreductase YuxK
MRFVAIQSTDGRALALEHGIDPDSPLSFLFFHHGHVLAKSDGVVALCGYLRWPWRIGRVVSLLPRPVRDWLYDCIARNRYAWFGKRDVCFVPDRETRARFVLPDTPKQT